MFNSIDRYTVRIRFEERGNLNGYFHILNIVKKFLNGILVF